MVSVEVIIVFFFISFVKLVNCSLENDDKENEISVDSVAKPSTSKNAAGHCTNDDCYEFKPIQIYVPHSPLIPCDKV